MRPVPPLFRATWLALLFSVFAGPALSQNLPCPDAPLYPPTRAFLQPPRPCPGQDVRLLFATCAPCWDIVDVSQGPDGITVRTEQRPNECIPTVCLPESASVGLGSFAAGHHALVVRFVTEAVRRDTANADSVLCTFINVDTLHFEVAPTCFQDTLPYVKQVVIGGPPPCPTCPPQICAGDSIPVMIRGEFPNDCIHLQGVEVLPRRDTGAYPAPPYVRIVYSMNDCIEQPCVQRIVPWEAKVVLPALPASGIQVYWLPVSTALVRYQCDLPPDSTLIGEAQFPFAVSEQCSTRFDDCFLTSFETVLGGEPRCDDYVGDGTAHATFRLGSAVPLHGLEGRFVFDSPGLIVAGMETVGAATGMRLAWQPTEDGAKFVLYSEGGAAIPAAHPMPSSEHLPILRVEVGLRAYPQRDPMPTLPPRIRMLVSGLLGADRAGAGVFPCPVMTLVVPFDNFAVFCTGGTCDLNRDGSTDVRDLVGMLNCLNDLMLCDLTRADCNGDGVFGLEDVMCCAHVLLGGGPPDTTGGRPDPSLRVRFGAPAENNGTIEIPVTLDGAHPVAAARLVMRYPSDRFDVEAVFPGRSTWLELQGVRNGRLVVGMLDMGGLPSSSFQRAFTLRLTLKAGQQAGGEVAVEAAEFSDPGGVALLADLGVPTVILGGAGVALGAGQPNPFGREVRFAVTLAQEGDLEVSIHDLTGRRVAVLHRGSAIAGGHTFRWDGTDENGSRAPDGIYFYRARAAGQTLARKVILLRER